MKPAIVLSLTLSATSFANAAEQVRISYEIVGTEGESYVEDVRSYNWKTLVVDADELDETIERLESDATIGEINIPKKIEPMKPLERRKVYPTLQPQSVGEPLTVNDPVFSQQQVWQAFDEMSRGNLSIEQGMGIFNNDAAMKIGFIDGGFVETSDLSYAGGASLVFGERGAEFRENVLNPTCGDRHGTQVAHLASAKTNNGYGMAGIANSEIYAARVFPCDLSGHPLDFADAILYLAGEPVDGVPTLPEPVDVINMSLSGNDKCYAVIQDALDVARAKGIVVVVAAGNHYDDSANWYPGNCEGVVTVGSNNFFGQKSAFSNDGEEVDVFATGSSVLTSSDENEFVELSGTSFSTPIVAAHAALIKAAEAEADSSRVERLLESAQRPKKDNDGNDLPGAGVMDSLKLARSVSGDTYVARPLVHALMHEGRTSAEAYMHPKAQLDTCNLYEVDTTKLEKTLEEGEYFKVFEVAKTDYFTVTNGVEVSASQGSRVLLKNIDSDSNRYGLSVCNSDNSLCDSEIPVNLNVQKSFTNLYCG